MVEHRTNRLEVTSDLATSRQARPVTTAPERSGHRTACGPAMIHRTRPGGAVTWSDAASTGSGGGGVSLPPCQARLLRPALITALLLRCRNLRACPAGSPWAGAVAAHLRCAAL